MFHSCVAGLGTAFIYKILRSLAVHSPDDSAYKNASLLPLNLVLFAVKVHLVYIYGLSPRRMLFWLRYLYFHENFFLQEIRKSMQKHS